MQEAATLSRDGEHKRRGQYYLDPECQKERPPEWGPAWGLPVSRGTLGISAQKCGKIMETRTESSPEAVLGNPDRNRIQKFEASSVPFLAVVRVPQGVSLRQMDTTC